MLSFYTESLANVLDYDLMAPYEETSRWPSPARCRSDEERDRDGWSRAWPSSPDPELWCRSPSRVLLADLYTRSFQVPTNAQTALHASLQGIRSLSNELTRLFREPELVSQAEVLRTQSMEGSQVALRVNGHDLVSTAAVADTLLWLPRAVTATRTTGAGDTHWGAHAVLGPRLAPINVPMV